MIFPPLPLWPSKKAGRDVTGTIPAFAAKRLFLRAGEFEFPLPAPLLFEVGTACIELVKEEFRPMLAIVAAGGGGGAAEESPGMKHFGEGLGRKIWEWERRNKKKWTENVENMGGFERWETGPKT